MLKSTTMGLGCCELTALLLGCAQIQPPTGKEPQVDGGAGSNSGAAGDAGAAPSRGTGGSPAHSIPTDGQASTCSNGGCLEADAAVGVCGLVKAPLERLPPDVLIVLDRSLSMNDPVLPMNFDVGMFLACLLANNCPVTNSKWMDMTTALNASVSATSASVNYGLKFFPEDASCGVTDQVSVPIGANNAAAINGAIAKTQPGGQTPTASALTSAGRYLMSLDRPNPRFVLLATDGVPSCDPNAETASVTAAGNLFSAGIPVYVIGIATAGRSDTTLNAMATAGGKPRSGTPAYYPVETAADLGAALTAIGGQLASCSFTVKKPDPPLDPNNVAVDANGTRVPRNDAEGWRYGPNMTSIELTGSWCSRIQSGAITDIKATFACANSIIP